MNADIFVGGNSKNEVRDVFGDLDITVQISNSMPNGEHRPHIKIIKFSGESITMSEVSAAVAGNEIDESNNPTAALFQPTINVNVIQNQTATQNVSQAAPVAPVFLMQPKKQSFFVRAIWFVCVGWWLSAFFILLGYLFMATLILAPIGFWFLNRVPQAQTLRTRNSDFTVTAKDGISFITETNTRQHPWFLRLLYLPVGLIVGAFWLSAAWVFGVLIITLPLSVWMIDRSPAVITLQKN